MKDIDYDNFDTFYFYGKPCIKCGETIRYKKGHKRCVSCCLAYKEKYREEKREELNAKSREYHRANKDSIHQRKVEYRKTERYREVRTSHYLRNKDKISEQVKIWKSKNKEKLRQAGRNYYIRHTEKEKERKREYRLENPVLYKMAAIRRRTREIESEGYFTQEEWDNLCRKYNNMCLCCKRKDVPLAADHIVPLSKGGSSWISNIQNLCKECNSRKNAKTIDYRPYFSYN